MSADPFSLFAHEPNAVADFARVPGEALLMSAQTQLKLKGNKVSAGTMHLSTTRLVWCAAGSVTPSMSFPFAAIRNHQYSPPGAAATLIKLTTTSGPFVFVFSSPTAALADRDALREMLSQVKKPVKDAPKPEKTDAVKPDTAASASLMASAASTAVKAEPADEVRTVVPDAALVPLKSDEIKPENKLAAAVARPPASGIHVTEARRRAELLSADSQVKLLHAELVLSGIVSEEEFWQMRQDDLRMAADRPRSQQRGVRSALVADVEPVVRNSEREHYRLTPSVIRAIFESSPPVLRAFQQLVPDRLSEQDFWAKYLAARHFHRLKTKSTRRRTRTNETPEDTLLSRAIEESERAALGQSMATVAAAGDISTMTVVDPAVAAASAIEAPPARPPVARDIDMTANDSQFDAEHYGLRRDTMMRAEPSPAVAALVARTNQHSARVLAAEHDLPSITQLVQRSAAADADAAAAKASAAQLSAPVLHEELVPVEQPALIPLQLASRRAHASESAAAAAEAAAAAQGDSGLRKRRRATASLFGSFAVGGALQAPPVAACQDLVRRFELRERANERARHEKSKKRAAGGSTLTEVYQSAHPSNVATMAELLRGDSAGSFLEDLYRRFARGNELLRHFWGSFPLVNRANVAKATRVANALTALSVELDNELAALPLVLKGRLAPMLIELRARLDTALGRFEHAMAVLAKRGKTSE